MLLGEEFLYPTSENYVVHVFIYHGVFPGYISKCLFHLQYDWIATAIFYGYFNLI